MPCDRFVWWDGKKQKRPTRTNVGIVCEDYLKGLGTVTWSNEGRRFMCLLHGPISHPLNRIKGAFAVPEPGEGFDQRYIEVIPSGNCIDVLTRQQDEITNAIADGLSKIFARFWQGRLEE